MTELALRAPALVPFLSSAIGGTAYALAATYRLGGRALIAAPFLIGIAVLPELAQHVVEISLGMFKSAEGFIAGANDPLRWAFAYPKVVGFAVAILAVTRFWALGSVRAALMIRPIVLARVAILAILPVVAAQPFLWLRSVGDSPALDLLVSAASLLLQAGVLMLLIAALVEDRLSVRAAFFERFPTALLVTLLAAAAFLPAQMLHGWHHSVALGQPEPIVWALMVWDSLWVGLMAALTGSALFVGYRCGPTWSGWSVKPSALG